VVTHTDDSIYLQLASFIGTKTGTEQMKGEEEMSFVLTHERRGGARRTHGEVVEHQTLAATKQLHI
jgi:hypothetical protein